MPVRDTPRPPRADVALAAVFLVLSLVQIAIAPITTPVLSVVVAVGSAAPVAWRRVHPVAAALAGTAVWLIPTTGFLLLGYVIAVVLFFSLGAYAARWQVVAVSAVGTAVGVAVTLLGPEPAPAAIGAALVVIAPATAGRLVAHQRTQNA